MPSKRETVYLHGKIYWAKIFGTPRNNYAGDAREWGFEFEPDEAGVAELEARGLGDRLKSKAGKTGYEDRKPFLNLKRGEFKSDGTPNEHIRVVDADNGEWSDKNKIGNGSEADVKLNIVDYGVGKFDGIYPLAIRVLDLVPFKSNEFAPLESDDPRLQKAKARTSTFAEDFGLEEDTPDEPAEEVAPAKPSGQKKAVLDEGELDDDVL